MCAVIRWFVEREHRSGKVSGRNICWITSVAAAFALIFPIQIERCAEKELNKRLTWLGGSHDGGLLSAAGRFKSSRSANCLPVSAKTARHCVIVGQQVSCWGMKSSPELPCMLQLALLDSVVIEYPQPIS